jgi:hypothetical protein
MFHLHTVAYRYQSHGVPKFVEEPIRMLREPKIVQPLTKSIFL